MFYLHRLPHSFQYRVSYSAVLLLSLLLFVSAHLCAKPLVIESSGMQISVIKIASGLSIPWGMTQIDEDTLLITERSGSVLRVNRHTGAKYPIKGVPKVWAEGQGGLLDVAVPRLVLLTANQLTRNSDDAWVYFTYSKPVSGGAATTLGRAQLSNNALINWQDLLVTRSSSESGHHFGSRVAFDGQGHVYFSVGDRGERDNAQDLTNHAGAILRLNWDGSLPPDNPFITQQGALPELWSVGHRNPQGLVFDYATERLWSIEHGPRGGDEINLINAGKNYGWPIISYGKEYWGPVSVGEATHKEGFEQPIKYYVPSIAPGSLLIYRGKAFPAWSGDLFAGALKLMHLNRVSVDKKGKAIGEERLLESLGERVRSLAESQEGWLYIATDSGNLYVLKPI